MSSGHPTTHLDRYCPPCSFFYASSACIYPEGMQLNTEVEGGGLKEESAWPAQPQDAYGLEKLATEELCKHYDADFGIACRIARFHNIYGPYGTWKGGREKAPAAFCRKAICASVRMHPFSSPHSATKIVAMCPHLLPRVSPVWAQASVARLSAIHRMCHLRVVKLQGVPRHGESGASPKTSPTGLPPWSSRVSTCLILLR
jgi:hypothetical protein